MKFLALINDLMPWVSNSLGYFIKEMKRLHYDSIVNPDNFAFNKKRFNQFTGYCNLIIDYLSGYGFAEQSLPVSSGLLMLERDKSGSLAGESLSFIDDLLINDLKRVSEFNQLINNHSNDELINNYVIELILEHELYEAFDFFKN